MRSLRSPAAAGLILVAVTGCKEAKPAKASTTQSTVAAQPVSSGLRDYTIDASDYAYTDLPLHAPAGWLTLRLVNVGSEQHMLGVIAVPTGYTVTTLIDSMVHLHTPANVVSVPGVDVISPTDTGVVTAFFAPGQYVVGCFVKSPDGTYHVAKGMTGSFDVVAYADSGTVPRPDAVVSLSDRHITLSHDVKVGPRTLRITTDNPHWADFQILRLLPGRTAADAIHWYDNRSTVAPAAEAFGGVSSVQSSQRSFMTANFTPGRYLLLFPIGGTDAHPDFARYTLTVAP